jgi:RNA polymerase sigma-70 factor, ECF subfamily
VDDRDAEFEAFVAGRSTALLRTAYLLTGDPARAEELLRASLAKTYLAWKRIKDLGAVETYVRRDLVRGLILPWHRWRDRGRAAPDHPLAPDDDSDGATDRAAVWRLLAALPATQRTALVLRYSADLSETEIAHDLQSTARLVRRYVSRGLETLEVGLAEAGRPRTPIEPLVQETLAQAASTIGPKSGLAASAQGTARRIRSSRRLRALGGVGVCAVVVLAIAALSAPSHAPVPAADPSPTVTPPLVTVSSPSLSVADVLARLDVLSAQGSEIFDGRQTIELEPSPAPGSRIDAIARVSDGYVVTVEDDQRWSLDHVDRAGQVRILDHRQRAAPGDLTGSPEFGVAPDGKTIAYVVWTSFENSAVTTVRVIDTAGHEVQQLELDGVYSPTAVDDKQVWLHSEVNEVIQPAIIWNRVSGAIEQLDPGQPTTIRSLNLPHGWATLAGYSCNLMLVRVARPEEVVARRCGTMPFSFSPYDSVLMSGVQPRDPVTNGEVVQVMSDQDLHVRWSLPVPISITKFSWTPNGHFVGVGFDGGIADVDPKTGRVQVYDTSHVDGGLVLAPTS